MKCSNTFAVSDGSDWPIAPSVGRTLSDHTDRRQVGQGCAEPRRDVLELLPPASTMAYRLACGGGDQCVRLSLEN